MTRFSLKFPALLGTTATAETLRVFLIFGILLTIIAYLVGDLAFKELGVQVLRQRVDLGQTAAVEIAREVAELGREGSRIDYAKLRRSRARLEDLIRDRLADQGFIRRVEIRDRFGARLVLVADQGPAIEGGGALGAPDWPSLDQEILHAPLDPLAPVREGEVLLGISPTAAQGELAQLSRKLEVRLAVAAVLALAVLAGGLFYVLHLIRKNRGLEQARQSAERASYVGLLASGLAHEIRNPLNAMNINLQLLEEELVARPGGVAADHQELLESTKIEIKRLERLVNNFLAYARPAAARFEPRDVNALAAEVMRLLDVDFRQSQVELVADFEPLLPEVELDEAQFKQALINLLVNARQVLKQGGRVVVRTRTDAGGDAVIEVRDSGPGVPPEVQERIFEVFYSSRGGGTGLGLPIARQVVERHGGTIEVESVEGQGATFRIRLPRRHPTAGGVAANLGRR